MTQSQKLELKENIKAQIEKIGQENEKLKPSLYPLKKDCSIDTVAHQALKQEQALAMQRLEENNMRLNRLHSALMRIDTPNYGICEECEEPIALERLKLIPESRYCIECLNELNPNYAL